MNLTEIHLALVCYCRRSFGRIFCNNIGEQVYRGSFTLGPGFPSSPLGPGAPLGPGGPFKQDKPHINDEPSPF